MHNVCDGPSVEGQPVAHVEPMMRRMSSCPLGKPLVKSRQMHRERAGLSTFVIKRC